jgi:ribonuclease P protein component
LPRSRLGFGRHQRVVSAADFGAALKQGARSRDDYFTIYALPNANHQSRLGLTVSRKTAARAVVRNRIKRQVRESFRLSQAALPHCDIIVVAQPRSSTATAAALRAALRAHWARISSLCVPSV